MPDVFISYSTHDEEFARFLQRHLQTEGLEIFLASVSLPPGTPGTKWDQAILEALRNSKWVLFLASKAACRSSYVLQEMGGAVMAQKNIVPILWNMPPSELPGWTQSYQALNLAGSNPDQVWAHLTGIAGRIKVEKFWGAVVAALLIAGLVYAAKGN